MSTYHVYERCKDRKGIEKDWREQNRQEDRVVVSWEAVLVNSSWTWLCAYKQRAAHPKSNYKMFKDHSMKLVSLSLFHPLFPSLCGSSFQSVFFFTRFFSRFAQKNRSCTFLYSPIVPLHESILGDPLSFYLSKGWMGLPWWRKSTWFWYSNHRLTFSCACAHPFSYVLNLKSWWDKRE